MFLPDYCLFCGFVFPRSEVKRESLVFSFRSILMKFGFSKGVEDTCERKKKECFLLLMFITTVWGHIQSLGGVYIELHAFAISVCWLYKATLKTYYHRVCFFSLRTVVQKQGFTLHNDICS